MSRSLSSAGSQHGGAQTLSFTEEVIFFSALESLLGPRLVQTTLLRAPKIAPGT